MNLRTSHGAAPSRRRPVRWQTVAGLALCSLILSSCGEDSPLSVADVEIAAAPAVSDTNLSVRDLAVTAVTTTTLTVTWTQVANEVGEPAWYRVKYAPSPLTNWKSAAIACDRSIMGTQVGAPMSCTIEGLSEATSYDVQLMSFRTVKGIWQGSTYSNVATATTASSTSPAADATTVQDLAVSGATDATLTVRWTQIDDGTGQPADYRVKYGASPLTDWKSATMGCDFDGTAIGAEASCTVAGLPSGATYDLQLMSYRSENGSWQNTQYSNVATGRTGTTTTSLTVSTTVQDLAVTAATDASVSLRWTQVDDGTGQPADYRVRYGGSPLTDWKSAAKGCDVDGTQIGAPVTCTVQGLSSATRYDFQLMSYRVENGSWLNARYSNLATGETAAGSGGGSGGGGLWISPGEIAALPTSGSAWNNVKSAADGSCGSVDLANQDQTNNVCIMAKALVYARIGGSGYRDAVVDAIRQIVSSGTYDGRALALGRELGAYVIAADVIGLASVDPSLDGAFRTKLRELLTAYTWGAASSLVDCHEKRPNNWGAHCGATRAAIAVYLGDTDEIARTAQVFKGYLGDRASYAGFSYGGPEDDLSWQCDPTRPVGINPAGCTRDGHTLDAVLPDDQRRGGSYTWPAPKENYVWEALQGLLAQAVVLNRAGYPVWDWEDRALLRAVRWLHDVNGFPAEGDDGWQPHVVNHYYGTSFPAPDPARYGKNVGWTDWTHG